MPETDIYVPINANILKVVYEIKYHLEKEFLIQATQQDIIENAIVALKLELK